MLSIPTQKIVKILLTITIVLGLLGLLRSIFEYVLDFEFGYELLDVFNLNDEHNIPAWYASVILLLCSLIIYFIYLYKQSLQDKFRKHWLWLGIIFTYLSLDEAISIHENFKLRFLFSKDHILYDDSWVIVGGILVTIFVFSYRRFLQHLPHKFSQLFLLSGFIYVFGSGGMEVVGSFTQEFYGKASMVHAIAIVLEEFLEMLGIVLFIHTLLLYASSLIDTMQFE